MYQNLFHILLLLANFLFFFARKGALRHGLCRHSLPGTASLETMAAIMKAWPMVEGGAYVQKNLPHGSQIFLKVIQARNGDMLGMEGAGNICI